MIKANTSLDVERVLGEGGLIAQNFSGFEHRNEQIQMAEAVAKSLDKGGRLAVEAGTGVAELTDRWQPGLENFRRERKAFLVYR